MQSNLDTLILNDTHAGVIRTAGTTPFTRLRLQDWLRTQLDTRLKHCWDKHVVFNGDLLDKFEVPTAEVVRVYRILAHWVENSTPEAKLWLLAGNHDISAKGEKMSSFALLCEMLTSRFPGKVVAHLMEGLAHIHSDIWAIPHCANQDLFDMELDRVVDTINEGENIRFLLLHANYDNNFAAQSDHSLNVSAERAAALANAGVTMVFGHEHQYRIEMGGKVVITGNQWATSIADCLGNDDKRCLTIRSDGSLQWDVTQDITQDMVQVDWKELTFDIDALYVRVTGDCSAESAQDMITAISKFRAKSGAFVVSNAVKVAGVEGLEDFETISFENIKAFDVLGELLALLTEPEAAEVKRLIEIENSQQD